MAAVFRVQPRARVRVNIDEACGDVETGDVQGVARSVAGKIAHCRDAVSDKGHVRNEFGFVGHGLQGSARAG